MELLDDVVDCLVMFEVILDGVAEELCFMFFFEDGVVNFELDRFWLLKVEDGVVGFCWLGTRLLLWK